MITIIKKQNEEALLGEESFKGFEEATDGQPIS